MRLIWSESVAERAHTKAFTIPERRRGGGDAT